MTGGQMDTVKVELFGQDPKIQKALSMARNVSVTKAPVLIIGENGVGKKALARYIHQNSTRSNKPFCMVDCALSPEEVENAILGHRDPETGKFNRGVLEQSNGGTAVFANIDCLNEEFQKKLHKIINELPDYDIDVRLVATTTKNLSKLVGAGRFYRGLFNQVATNAISLMPLRDRPHDLESMAKSIIQEIAGGERQLTVDQSAMDKILGHYWSYNVAELQEVLTESLRDFEGDTVLEDHLTIGEKRNVTPIVDDESDGIRLMSLRDAEKLLIKKALIHTSENRTQAAKILGVSIRTLRNKINEYRTSGNSYFVNLR